MTRFLLLIVLLLVSSSSEAVLKRAYHPRSFRVVDGDTIVVNFKSGERKLRVHNYDSPELEIACERKIALDAKNLLVKYSSDPKFYVRETGKRDKYGRRLAGFYLGKKDLAPLMISSGLARPYSGGKRSNWCASARRR